MRDIESLAALDDGVRVTPFLHESAHFSDLRAAVWHLDRAEGADRVLLAAERPRCDRLAHRGLRRHKALRVREMSGATGRRGANARHRGERTGPRVARPSPQGR